MQRYSFSTQRPDRDTTGEYVRFKDVQALIRKLVRESSQTATACHSMIPDSVLEEVCEQVGLRFATETDAA